MYLRQLQLAMGTPVTFRIRSDRQDVHVQPYTRSQIGRRRKLGSAPNS